MIVNKEAVGGSHEAKAITPVEAAITSVTSLTVSTSGASILNSLKVHG